MNFLTGPKEKGIIYIPILVAVIALIGFVFVSSSADFKDKLFATLFPSKPKSQAVGSQALPLPPDYPNPVATGVSYDSSDFYGVNVPNEIYPVHASDTEMSILRDDLSKAGVKWLRTDISPFLFYTFSNCPGGVNEIRSDCSINKLDGFKILGSLNHITMDSAYLICPADGFRNMNNGSPLFTSSSFTLDNWIKTVDCVSKIFKGKIQAYEIWNEPTDPAFKKGYQDGSPGHYFEMLKLAYETIKKNDPNATVIGLGGMSLWGNGNNGTCSSDYRGCFADRDKTFSKAVKDLGGASYADAISVHAYSWENPYEGWLMGTFADNMRYHKDLWGKPVWVTETGYLDNWNSNQSKYMRDIYSAFINAGVSHILWFALKDTPSAGQVGIVGRSTHDYMKAFINTPKKGAIRVLTDPPNGAKIKFSALDLPGNPVITGGPPCSNWENGQQIPYWNWGLNWCKVQKGRYKLSFEGYPASDKEIEIKSGMTTVIKVNLTENRYIPIGCDEQPSSSGESPTYCWNDDQ